MAVAPGNILYGLFLPAPIPTFHKNCKMYAQTCMRVVFFHYLCTKQKDRKMNIGDMAPDVLGRDQNGEEVKLADYAGKRIALYFYPKDNTSGCTAEACSLRDSHEALREAGYEIIGVSVDSEKSHQNFIAKHGLPFRLVADTDKRLVETFGVWVEKSMYGRKYMGTARTTFLIGTDGRVERIIGPKEIKTKTHGEQLLAAIAG